MAARPRGLIRLAGLALGDTGARPLGAEAFSVQLSGLQQPARMVGLWAEIAELDVTRQVLDRYPDALVRVHWLDPYTYATDAQYEWVDWQTGEIRPTQLTPPRRNLLTRTQQHARAVQGVLAFFEGADS